MRLNGLLLTLGATTCGVGVALVCCSPFSSSDAATEADDGSVAADGGLADANADGGLQGTRFCAAMDATFCADFDGVDYLEGWTVQTAAAANTQDDMQSYVSPPSSASVSVSLITAASTYGRLTHPLPGAPLELVIDAQIRLAELPDGATLVPISLRFGPTADDSVRFETGLQQAPDGLHMFETSHHYPEGGSPTLFGTGFPYGDAGGFNGWTGVRIKVSLDPAGNASTATFRVGNGPDRTINLIAADAPSIAPPVTLVVGVVSANLIEAGTAQVAMDNIVVNAH